MTGIDLHSACAQVMAWQQHLAGINLRWGETGKAESLAVLSAECFRLHRSLEEVLESSQLLKMLPEELLLRIFTRLDAKALGTLESVSRRFGSGLVDRAVAHAAVEQHGEKLAALQPKYLSAARRLWSLEVAVEAGTSFVTNAAQQVESNEASWVWPVTSPFANEDQGAHALATVLAASASPPPPPPPPPVPPLPEQDLAVDASPRQKALVKLVSKLATGGERAFVEPESPAGAVQWLADELHRGALSAPDRTFTLDAIKTLLGEVPGTYCKLEPKEKLVLIRTMWQHCNKTVGTRDGLTQAITRGLQLYSELKRDNAEFPEKIELLQKIREQQAQQPERWANDQRQHMPEQSHFQVTLMLAGAMRENGMCPSAVALLRQVAAKCSGHEERSHLWARECINAARELRRLGELGPCEQLYREILGVQERICKPTDLGRISVEVHLVSLLVECGNLLEAETRQRSLAAVCRQIADELAAKKLEQQLIQQDTDHRLDAMFQRNGFVHAFESLAGHSSTPRVIFSNNVGFEKDLGLYQLLMRQGKHEEAQQVVAPAMLDLYFAMLSGSWDGAWLGTGEGGGGTGEGMPRAEPQEWAARREQLEELLGVDQVQKSVEAKFSALVLKLVAEVGMVHASTLFVRGRQAFVLRHYGKLQDARAHLETLVTDFGTSIAPGAANDCALCAVEGLETILGALGLREEYKVLRRRCVEAEGDPEKLKEHDLRIRVMEEVRNGNWAAVTSGLSSLLELKGTDKSSRYCDLVVYGNLIAWSMQGHQLDAEPLLREARELELNCASRLHLADRNLDLARILFVLSAADFDKQVNSTAMESRLKEAEQVLTEAIMVDVTESAFPNKQCVATCKYLLALVLKLAAAVLKLKYDSALEEALEGTLNDVAAHAVATSSELLARQRNERLDKLEQATRLMVELVSCHKGKDADTFREYTGDPISSNVPMPDDVCKIPDHDVCCQAVARLLQLQERHEEASEWWEEWEEGMGEGSDEDEDEDEETTQDEDAQGNAKRVRHDTR